MMDSIIAANGGAASSSTGPRRLVITEPPPLRQWPEAALLGRAVADSLRRMLRARPKQYTIIDPDSVRLAMTTSRDLGELTKNLSSDLAVSIRITVMPHDSAFLFFQVNDLGAITTYRSRGASSRAVPKNEVLINLDQMLLSVVDVPRRDEPRAAARELSGRRSAFADDRDDAAVAVVVGDVEQADLQRRGARARS